MEVDLLTYASHGPLGSDPERWRALDGFRHLHPPAWTAPRRIRSGPAPGKPLADLALLARLRDAVASRMRSGASYDAIMTHHIEACVISMLGSMTQRRGAIPLIYCVHTLLERELASYAGPLLRFRASSSSTGGPSERRRGWVRAIDQAGGRLERWAGRRVDGWIALTQESARVMRGVSVMPGRVIPPPLPDPQRSPDRLDPETIARTLGLETDGYLLYSGNLDAYQELDLLAAAVARRPSRARLPVVVATHAAASGSRRAAGGATRAAGPRRKAEKRLEVVEVQSAAQMRALLQGARASVVPRRSEGGFPIKLVNSLAAGTAPIVFQDREWGLRNGTDALVADGRDPVAGLAEALTRLEDEPGLALRLGAGARATYLRRHRPGVVAAETLELIEAVIATRRSRVRRDRGDAGPRPGRSH